MGGGVMVMIKKGGSFGDDGEDHGASGHLFLLIMACARSA